MYLHTGKGRIVFLRELIGILKYNLFGIGPSEQNLMSIYQNANQPTTKRVRSQSIIVTNRDIFSAPTSSSTLVGRSTKN